MKERESGSARLSPSIWHSRYYYLWQLRKAIEKVIRIIIAPTIKKDFQIADFGCGNMPYKPLFDNYAVRYIGIDLPENPQADIHILPEGTIAMPDSAIDLVVSTQVLEHVSNPTLYLAEAHRILKTEGMLVLTTHGYWMYHPDPTDFWRWTSMGLQKIVAEAGFEIIHFQGIIGRSAMGMQLVQDGILPKIPTFLRPLFTIPMQFWIFALDLIHSPTNRNKDACTFVVVAQKV